MTKTWTDSRIARLTEFWNDGVSASLIAKKMGLTKGAVIGKAHRLGLVGRPSPILRNVPRAQKREERLAMVAAPVDKNPPISESLAPAPAQPNPNSAPICLPEVLRRGACQFIAGEKGVDFKLYVDAPRCPAEVRPGSPYCVEHHIRCHATPAAEAAA